MKLKTIGKILIGAGFVVVLVSGYLAPKYMMYSLIPVVVGMLVMMYARMR